MSAPAASRRHLFGAGAAVLLLAPFAAGAAKASEIDGDLLRLCALLEVSRPTSGVLPTTPTTRT